MQSALSDLETSGNNLKSTLTSLQYAWQNYGLITDVVNQKTDLTNDQMLQLVSAMPDMQQYLKRTTQGWTLESGAMSLIQDSVTGLQDSYIAAQQAMSNDALQEAAVRKNILWSDFQNVQSLAQAYAMLAAQTSGGLQISIGTSGMLDMSSLDSDSRLLMTYAQNKIMSDKAQEMLDQSTYGYIFDKYSIDELFDANGEFNDLYYQMRDFIAQTAPTELEAFETAAEAAQAAKQGFMDAAEAAEDAKQQQEEIKRQQEDIADNQALEKVQTYLDL